jgi:hypothetical protein
VVEEPTPPGIFTVVPVRNDWPRVRGAVIRFMALPAPRLPLIVFAASGWDRWGAAGLTIPPLDQDFPCFSIVRVKVLGREGQAFPGKMPGVSGNPVSYGISWCREGICDAPR